MAFAIVPSFDEQLTCEGLGASGKSDAIGLCLPQLGRKSKNISKGRQRT
jgi:hypothetical protein